jgi:hypothetical protein
MTSVIAWTLTRVLATLTAIATANEVAAMIIASLTSTANHIP